MASMLALQGQRLLASFNDGTFRVMFGKSSVLSGQWTHAALSWGENGLVFYVNGKIYLSSTPLHHGDYIRLRFGKSG